MLNLPGIGKLSTVLVSVLLFSLFLPSTPSPQATNDYNFIERADQATWQSGAGELPFPGQESDDRGFALFRQGAKLEDGVVYPFILQTHPQWTANGWISGSYPPVTIGSGAELYVQAGFLNGAQGSDGVTFLVKVLEPGAKPVTLVNLPAAYDGQLDEASVSLAAYAGKTVAFELIVKAGQSSGKDWAVWAEAKIEVAAPPALPDLIVEDVWQADNTIRYKIKNVGEGSAVNPPGGITPSCNALFIDGQLVAKDCVNIHEMLPGQSIDNPFDYDWEMTPPEHEIQVCADWDKVFVESNEQNNCWEGVWTMEEERLPDLVIEEIQCDQENRRIGYVVKNVGDQVAPAGQRTALLIQGSAVDEDEVDISLEPGDTYEGYFENYENYKWTSNDVLTICADYYNNVGEASEDNNCRRGECVLEEEGPPPPTELLPDLMVDPYYPVTLDYRTYPKYITSLELDTHLIYVTELGFTYHLWNPGAAPAPATWTEIYINGVKVAEQQVEPLDSGERREEWVPVHWDCTPCTEQVTEFQLDAREEIAEDSEFNNNHTKTWTCSYLMLPSIDLAAENIRIDPGNSKITFTLTNRGDGESPETYAHLWIDEVRVESLRIAPLAAGHSRDEHFNYPLQCTHTEDGIRVEVDPVIRVVDDCRGTEIGLGELDSRNNQAEVTWVCEYPDLMIEYSISQEEGVVHYTITNEGSYPAGPSATGLYVYDEEGEIVFESSDDVAELEAGESREESFSEPFPCPPPGVRIGVEADINGAVTEIWETNNLRVRELLCGPMGTADLLISRIWLEDSSTVCYEIMNQGTVESWPTETKISMGCGSYCSPGESIDRDEPSLSSGGSRTVCVELFPLHSDYGFHHARTWCGCKELVVRVTANAGLAYIPDPNGNNELTETFDNLCADGIQNQGEEGIDCGGPCPASCLDCFADADFGHAENAGYFSLDSSVVLDTARQALQEYANCLRDIPSGCRATLHVTDPLMNFSTVTPADLEQSTDYIMEAVAYYVDLHTQYMYDDDCDICDRGGGWGLDPSGAINAEDMILLSGERSGKIAVDPDEYVDSCGRFYCGDCEDHAILREALMRSLGVSWRCAFCADYYDGYFGGPEGHTFNLVYYRNKWRIMDYGSLGRYFPIDEYESKHNPDNVWNDRLGEYWCLDARSDPACAYCCNHDPYSRTQNYNDGEACWSSDDWTYYEECAP